MGKVIHGVLLLSIIASFYSCRDTVSETLECVQTDQLDSVTIGSYWSQRFFYDEQARIKKIQLFVFGSLALENTYVYIDNFTVEVQSKNQCAYLLHLDANGYPQKTTSCVNASVLSVYYYKDNLLDSIAKFSATGGSAGFTKFSNYLNGNPQRVNYGNSFNIHQQKWYGFPMNFTYDNGANPYAHKKFKVTDLSWWSVNNPVIQTGGIGASHTIENLYEQNLLKNQTWRPNVYDFTTYVFHYHCE